MTVTITVSAQFTDSNGTPATGLILTEVDITLVSIRKSDGNETVIWNALDATRKVTGLGMYQKDYASADLDTYWYFAMAEYVGVTVLDSDFVFGSVGEAGLDVNGRVDVGDWLGQAVTLSANNNPDVNVDEISDDLVAPQNLELQYDTTGLTGDTFPATQAQVGNIASGTAATNTIATSVTVTTGTEVNSYTDTAELDGTTHEVNPVGGNTDFYYEFNVGANGVPVAVQWQGYANSQGDTYDIYAWNWSGSAWQQIGSVSGTALSTISTEIFDLTTGHVGTGVNVGLVRWRALSTDGTGFNTDRILCSFATNFVSVGYDDGAIWIDTNVSNTNTELFIDGVADNPVSTWAAALTINTTLGTNKFRIANGSTIALTGNSDNYALDGDNWTLALGGQSIAGFHVFGASVSGIGTGVGHDFHDCRINAVTLASGMIRESGIAGPITASGAADYFLDRCHSMVAGVSTPTFDFGAAVGNTSLNMRNWSGGIEIENMGGAGTDTMSLEGDGQLVINANCSAGIVAIRGHFTITDNASGALTLSDDARYDGTQIENFVWNTIISKSAHNIAKSAAKYLRQIGQLHVWEGTAQGPGTGTNQIQLDTGASALNGTYDPSTIFIVDGSGAGQTRQIWQYDGGSRTASVDRDWKVNPAADSEFVIVPDAGRGHVNEGLAQGGTPTTITLNTLASSVHNVYVGQRVFIASGTGADQVGRIIAYDGGTKVATVAQTWGTTPDSTSGYAMLPDAPALFQGYEGAAIWIDTINGTAGTVSYENGTAENPVDTLADATTLATNLGFPKFMIAPGSLLTLAQGYDGFAFGGVGGNGWTLALGGQSISGATIIGAAVSGICTGSNAPSFLDCSIGSVTAPVSRFIGCAITSSIVCTAVGAYIFDQCFSGVAGTGSPDIDFGAAVGNTQLNFRHYSGGIEIKNMGAAITDTMSLEGWGQLIINANCVAGTVAIRGHFTVTDNAGGALTLSDDARIDIAQINAQADLALSDYDGPTNAQMEARTLLAANYGTSANQVTMLGVIGALTDAAAAGDPTVSDTIMQYVKQLVNILVGTAGVTTFPASAAPANGVSLAEVIRAIYDDSNELQGDWVDTGRLDTILDARASQVTADAIETDTQDIQNRLPAALIGGRISSDVQAISADSVAADNLEATYDGTGYTDDEAPATQAQADRNAALGESNRGSHTWSGNVYYVDPVNGATHGSGARGGRNDPYLTIQDCHDNAVTDSNHDVIILVAGAAGGVTTHTVAVTTTISKRYTFIRGPGRDFIWTRTGAGDTIAITADGVEISGVQIGTAATGSGDGVDITDADFTRIHNCWFLDTRGDGIHVLRGSNGRFHNNHFEGTGVGGSGQGIHIVGTAGSSNDNAIHRNHFAGTAGDSIRIESGTTNDTAIHHNEIHNSLAWGIFIGASSIDAQVHSNIFGNNASGDISDSGTDTILSNNEQWAKHSIATELRLAELDAGNIPTDLTNIETNTQDIQGRLPAALVSGRMDSDIRAVNGNTTSATKLALSANTMETGVALAGTLSTTEMTTDLTEVTDDHYNSRVLIWTSGNLLRQVASITGYVGSTKKLTFTAVTEAPIANDTWIMV